MARWEIVFKWSVFFSFFFLQCSQIHFSCIHLLLCDLYFHCSHSEMFVFDFSWQEICNNLEIIQLLRGDTVWIIWHLSDIAQGCACFCRSYTVWVLCSVEVCRDCVVPVVIIIFVCLDVFVPCWTWYSATMPFMFVCQVVCTLLEYGDQMRCTSALMNCDSSCQVPLLLPSSVGRFSVLMPHLPLSSLMTMLIVLRLTD